MARIVAESTIPVSSWRFWGRPEQWEPGSPGAALEATVWRWWAIVTGRGWGKTRTAAEWVVDRSEQFALAPHRSASAAGRGSRLHRVLLVAPTAADARDTMIEGESGLLAVLARRGYHADYEPSKRRITIPALRTVVSVHSAEKPDRIRGGQYHTAWLEEYAAWQAKLDETGESLGYANADLALRLPCPPGLEPRGVITTTPKPLVWIRALLARAENGQGTVRTSGSLYANVRNLSSAFVQAVLDRYEGTRWGQQEVHGQVLDVVEGALWSPALLDTHRVQFAPDLTRIVVGVDPPGETAEAGIIVEGSSSAGDVFVLEDASLPGTPEQWGSAVVAAVYRWGADLVVVEANQGGDMVRSTIHAVDPSVKVKKVRARDNKVTRAAPISALTERGRVHLVGWHPKLEEQLTTWVPGDDSPDRLDGFVWGATELFGDLVRPPAAAASPNRAAGPGRAPTATRRGARWSPTGGSRRGPR